MYCYSAQFHMLRTLQGHGTKVQPGWAHGLGPVKLLSTGNRLLLCLHVWFSLDKKIRRPCFQSSQYCKHQDFGQLASKAPSLRQWSEWECSGQSGNAIPAQQIPRGKSKSSSQIHKQKNHPFIYTWFSKYPNQIKFELLLFTVDQKHILEKEQCSLAWEILNNCALK